MFFGFVYIQRRRGKKKQGVWPILIFTNLTITWKEDNRQLCLLTKTNNDKWLVDGFIFGRKKTDRKKDLQARLYLGAIPFACLMFSELTNKKKQEEDSYDWCTAVRNTP